MLVAESRGMQRHPRQQGKENGRENEDEEGAHRRSAELRAHEARGQSSTSTGALQDRLRMRGRSVLQGSESRGDLSSPAEHRRADKGGA